MTDEVLSAARSLLGAEVVAHAEIHGGGNNRLLRIDTSTASYVAKRYFGGDTDRRDRLGAEFGFLQYAQRRGLSCVPAPIAKDERLRVGLYAFVDGRTVDAVTENGVRQAMAFFAALNRHPRDGALPDASEGRFRTADQMELVDRKLSRLREIDGEARDFVDELDRAWTGLKREFPPHVTELDIEDRCVSPSDFGFHNALERADGTVVFLDFEYAGWDDPAKAIGDFFCQPKVPVNLRWFDQVAEGFTRYSTHPATLATRARALLPLFWLKWCVIRLNEFLPRELKRRVFADPSLDVMARKAERLASARQALARLPEIAATLRP